MEARIAALEQERAVGERYSRAAGQAEEALCCPVDYDPRYLEAIPPEVLERDYGCGDPSRYIRPGETVLDLGSGGGKVCFIASQIVGKEGRVIGIDMNREMLALAIRAAPEVARRIGHGNVSFHRARIQDLALDLDRVDAWLRESPVRDSGELSRLEELCARERRDRPLVPDASVDIVVSSCVLNLVPDGEKPALIREIFRVLRPGGRIAISDIVSDETVPPELQDDPTLWSGCISGAFQEQQLVRELESAGFLALTIDDWRPEPFAVIQGIEFRSVTVTAVRGSSDECREANQAVIYRGPWSKVEDDDGHVLRRGERVAVCARTFELLTSSSYAGEVIPIEPRVPVAEAERPPFDCSRTAPRHPRETKGREYHETHQDLSGACGPEGCCGGGGDGGR